MNCPPGPLSPSLPPIRGAAFCSLSVTARAGLWGGVPAGAGCNRGPGCLKEAPSARTSQRSCPPGAYGALPESRQQLGLPALQGPMEGFWEQGPEWAPSAKVCTVGFHHPQGWVHSGEWAQAAAWPALGASGYKLTESAPGKCPPPRRQSEDSSRARGASGKGVDAAVQPR